MCYPNCNDTYLDQVMLSAILCLISLLILVRDADPFFDRFVYLLTIKVNEYSQTSHIRMRLWQDDLFGYANHQDVLLQDLVKSRSHEIWD